MPAHRRSTATSRLRSGPTDIRRVIPRLGRSTSRANNISMLLLPALIFDASQYTPSIINVATITSNDTARFPCIEAILGTGHRLHECIVNVRDVVGRIYTFLITCQTGEQLPPNRALRSLATDAGWRGSMVVMKCGVKSAFIGLHGTLDRDMAYRAAQRFMTDCTFSNATAEVRMEYPTEIWV